MYGFTCATISIAFLVEMRSRRACDHGLDEEVSGPRAIGRSFSIPAFGDEGSSHLCPLVAFDCHRSLGWLSTSLVRLPLRFRRATVLPCANTILAGEEIRHKGLPRPRPLHSCAAGNIIFDLVHAVCAFSWYDLYLLVDWDIFEEIDLSIGKLFSHV